jgi:hypothetical protein
LRVECSKVRSHPRKLPSFTVALARPSQLEAFVSHKWLKINEGGKKVSPTKQSG